MSPGRRRCCRSRRLDEAPLDYRPELVREAWSFVSDRADQLVSTFYAELFYRLSEAPMMFPSNMSRQRQEFGRAVVQWVVADDPETLSAHLAQLGADHRKFDVEPRHYEVAGLALVSAWRSLAGARWTADHEAAIVGSYTRLATIMIGGALQRANDPAYWGATVVGSSAPDPRLRGRAHPGRRALSVPGRAVPDPRGADAPQAVAGDVDRERAPQRQHLRHPRPGDRRVRRVGRAGRAHPASVTGSRSGRRGATTW